jgi:uncharacterized protein (DUF2236 family)
VRDDGVPYRALEPQAYAWVHATLLDTYVRAHARFGRPLRDGEVQRFYREYLALGRLIGVRERDLPATWAEFRTYFADTVEHELMHTPAVDQVVRTVRNLGPPPVDFPPVLWRAVRLPAQRALWLGGVGLIEPRLRRRLALRWGPVEDTQLRALGVVSRSLTPVMPASLRVTGPAQLRWRREAIARGPLGEGDRPSAGHAA